MQTFFRTGYNPTVIPAKAGIQYGVAAKTSCQGRSGIPIRKRRRNGKACLDSRLRGNDD
ncbi:MAG: hypothetical protein FWH15_05065 [Betaproteobacteria bacterium]|nr:hypothetical protein [Betaproteobacteria bacterium]